MSVDSMAKGRRKTCQAEVRHAWQVLKTAREEGNRENHLTFMEFIVGVQKIRDGQAIRLVRPVVAPKADVELRETAKAGNDNDGG